MITPPQQANGTTGIVAGSYNTAAWVLKNSGIIAPAVHQKLFHMYGKGLIGMADAMRALGRVEYVSNQQQTHVEKGAPLSPIKVGTQVATTIAGADATLVLDADCFDSNNDHPARQYQTLLIPGRYTGSGNNEQFWISALSGTNDNTLTLKPVQATANIATAIPADTVIMLGNFLFGPGTGQPDGTTDSYVTRTHNSAKLKETVKFETGIAAKQYEVGELNGKKQFLNKDVAAAEFKLDAQEDVYLTSGQAVTNTGITMTSNKGGTNQVVGGKGWVTWAEERGQSTTFDTIPMLEDYYDINMLLESQGVLAGEVNQFVGPQFNRLLEQGVRKDIKEFSGGTDLYDKMNAKYGIKIRKIEIGNIIYNIVPMSSWADPTRYGINVNGTYTYDYPEMSVIVPNTNVTVDFGDKKDVSLPNSFVGYVNNNGENLQRLIKYNPGVQAMIDTNIANNEYEGLDVYLTSAPMAFCAAVNQWVVIKKQ